jgi:hypothetical protein
MEFILTALTLGFMASVMPVALVSTPWTGNTLKYDLYAQSLGGEKSDDAQKTADKPAPEPEPEPQPTDTSC